MASTRPSLVFLGPTMARAEAMELCDAVYLPPVSQGMIVSEVQRHEPRAILIVDGIFQSEPAVRHKEILWAMAQGVTVLGAASMGALRAAELDRLGMIGVGLIYRWYRRYRFAPDDAVAVLQMPQELGSKAMTLSLIDLLMTFRRAERKKAVAGHERSRLEGAARRLNYRDRTLANVVKAAAVTVDLGLLDHHLVEQKRTDARRALRCLARVNDGPVPPTQDFTWTTAFARDLSHSGITPPVAIEGRERPGVCSKT